MIVFLLVSGAFYFSILIVLCRSFADAAGEKAHREEELFPKHRTELLKGIAALGILLSHLATHSNGVGAAQAPQYIYISVCKTLGFLGVDLFFLISGYGNFFSLSRKKTPRDRAAWLWTRILQILILYIICFLLDLLVLLLLGAPVGKTEILDSLLHLRMPLTSAWYLRIQLLVYVFMFAASFLKQQKLRILGLYFLCLLFSLVLYRMEYAEHWWMSTLCFPVGVSVAANRKQIADFLAKRKKLLLTGGIVLLPIALFLVSATDSFLLKIVGNVLLGVDMFCLAEIVRVRNRAYERIGAYSLTLYLAHISLNTWILRERVLTDVRVIAVVALSLGVAFAAKQLGDIVLQRAMKRH